MRRSLTPSDILKCRGFVLAISTFWALAVTADPLAPNRPGQADPPTVLAPGVAHIEGGMTFERETDGQPDTDTFTVPELELRLGVHERVELQVYADGLVHESRDGESNDTERSDMEVDARVVLWRQAGGRPATALDFGVSVPTGSGFATSDGIDPELEILYAWDFGESWNLNGNFDFASESQGKDDSGRNFVFRPELALGLGVNPRLSAFVEYYGVIEDGAADQHGVDGGIAFLVNDNFQLDASLGVGLNDETADFFVALGAAWRLPQLRE